MNPKILKKLILDFMLIVFLLLLMAFELVGQELHEWLGTAMLLAVFSHHLFNRKWYKVLFKGKYTPYRILQTVLVALLALCIVGTMVSGVMLSRYVFSFLPIHGGRSFARSLHMISVYWGFILMALHTGLHWNIVLGISRKIAKKPSKIREIILRVIATAIALYGVYALIQSNIISYMLLKEKFVFFDFERPLILFFADYISIMWLCGSIVYYVAAKLRKNNKD